MMPRKSKAVRLADLHTQALHNFEASYNATRQDREDGTFDRRFVNLRGAQWDWDTADSFKNKVKLEVNKCALASDRIKNEYRRNRVEAVFMPEDGTSDTLADACAARYRHDTRNGKGKVARDNAFDEAVDGGLGAWRFRADYEDKRGGKEYQRICAEPVYDALNCSFPDANATEEDKSDAMHWHLIRPWQRGAAEAKYGKNFATFPAGITGETIKFAWLAPDLVYVSEYFVVEEIPSKCVEFIGLDGSEEYYSEDELAEVDEALGLALRDVLLQTGYTEGETTKETKRQVLKYVLSGSGILEGPTRIPGEYIPIMHVYGRRQVIDNVERFRGAFRHARDAQIVENIQISQVAATAAISGIEKPIFTPEQMAGHETTWSRQHVDDPAFMLINPITDANGNQNPIGPIGFTKQPDLAPAVAALIQLADQNLQELLGSPMNAEKIEPNQSGVAIEMVQNRIDMQTSGYIENLGAAERWAAQVWLSMASEVYVEEGRKIKTIYEDGARGNVTIGKKLLNAKTGKLEPEIDFSRAGYDIDVDVGPSSMSKRNATVRNITSLMGVVGDPQTQAVLTNFALMNLDGEGISEIRAWSRDQLVKMNVVKPTKEEMAEMEAAAQEASAPDPNQIMAEAMDKEAEAKILTAQAGAMKSQADAALSVAKTEETQAKTAEIMANIPIAQRKEARAAAAELMPKQQGGNDDQQS